ncbi:MAG: hypothetical protein IKX45_08020 [Bacteroidales bacterium]|nr:hypothetical protein [Bacteroidales bacterium]
MIKKPMKSGYVSPLCKEVKLSPETHLLVLSDPALLDAFDVYDDSADPYFG